MSQQSHTVVKVDIALSAYLTSLPIARGLDEASLPVAGETRYSERTPTDQYLSAALPGVALSPKDLQRIQNLGTRN